MAIVEVIGRVKRGPEGGDLNYFAPKMARHFQTNEPNPEEMERVKALVKQTVPQSDLQKLESSYLKYQNLKSQSLLRALTRAEEEGLHFYTTQVALRLFGIERYELPREINNAYLKSIGFPFIVGERQLQPFVANLEEEMGILARKSEDRPSEEKKEDGEGDVRM